MSFAEIKNYNGAPTVMIDGKPFMPMAMTTRIKKPEYVKRLRESGVQIFFVFANTDWLRPGGERKDESGNTYYEPSGFEAFKKEVDCLLEAVPDAYIIVRIGMHPPVSWIEEHPEDTLTYSDGGFWPCNIVSEVHNDHVPGCYVMCSDNWRRDGSKALNDFCDLIDKSYFADRVIGFFLGAGGTSEWYYVTHLIDEAKNRYADHSPAFRKEFGRLLKEKYGTEENLRKAWKCEDASFDNPHIPNIEEREYMNIDKRIISALVNFECAEREECDSNSNPKSASRLGVFLNANDYFSVFDFYNAWHQGTANTVIHFAKVLKQRYEGMLVGSFYGAYGCTDYFDVGTCAGTLRILDSGVIDFLAAPGTYNNRELGGNVAQREMQDSFRLRNMLFVAEDDSRTHLDIDMYKNSHRLYSAKDTVKALKRDFARDICEGTFAWWFDQNEDGGRYQCEEIYELFARQQELSSKYAEMNREKKNEIALIYDQESINFVSKYTDQYVIDYYRTSDLARIGAPVDYYFHDDMARDDMPDYKMYVMINVYCLNDEERKVIDKKAAKNGATVVWLYASGFVNPDAETVMDNSNIEDIIGMHVERTDDTLFPTFKVTNTDHPAMKFADSDRFYGYIDREVCSNIWFGSVLDVPFMNPAFHIADDSAEVLGRYCMNDLPALALKKLDKGYTSVYCAPQVLRSELLTSLAEYSGCHIFNFDDDYICADESFVMIHAKYTGKHTLYFKKECNPYEVYEKKLYGENVKKIELEMRVGDTLMFHLNGEI